MPQDRPNDPFSFLVGYLDNQRKQQRDLEDQDLDKRISLMHDMLQAPGANPARTAELLQGILEMQGAKGGRSKAKGGVKGFTLGQHELPMPEILAGIIHGSIPIQGDTTEPVPKPKSAFDQGLMPEASTILPGLKTSLGGEQYPGHNEADFRNKYGAIAEQYGLNANPDDPSQFYDYRAAMNMGASPDADGHWPSEFKRAGHPNLVVDGIDTRTGQQFDGQAVLNSPVMIPPQPIQAPPEAAPMLSAARQMQQYNEGPKTRPVANQPMLRSQNEMARMEGEAAGVKAGAIADAQKAAVLKQLKDAGLGDAEIKQVLMRQAMGTSGQMQDSEAGYFQIGDRKVRAVRVFNPITGESKIVDATTGLSIPPDAVPISLSSTAETDPTSYKEYERVVADLKSRGVTAIPSYDQWLTTDANRKRPTTNMTVSGTGNTNQELGRLNSIIARKDMSPLIKAKDRTGTLTANIGALRANPGNAAAQMAMSYSFIQALDTYQSAVREGELRNLTLIDSKIGNLRLWAEQMTQGMIIRPEVATQIADAAQILVQAISQGAEEKMRQFRAQAAVNGLEAEWDEYIRRGSQAAPAGGSLVEWLTTP